MRTLILTSLLVAALAARGQADSSLTREFGKLSAKERARIARKEEEDARQDTKYQEVMAAAEELFRQQRYDDALLRFQEARELRPLNVHPKVKIQDLQAVIGKRDAERAAAEALAAEQAEQPKPGPIKAPPADTVVKAEFTPAPIPVPAETLPVVQQRQAEQDRPEPRVVGRVEQAAPVESLSTEGMQERTFTEGRAIVLERKLTRGGRMELYRKVTHPWGQILYFRDGAAISERHWNEVFP